jgi:two-component system, chemotaxis family, chemotaxis protein CheY
MNWQFKRIVVVEDEEIMRTFLVNSLRRLGITDVHTFADGQAALQALPQLKPDLVLTDVHMQPMGGLEFVRALREHAEPVLCAIKVIFLSADSSAATVGAALPLGVSGYIVKPPALHALSSKIEQALR